MMRLMDKHLIDHPTEGVLSMIAFLRDYNFHVNPKRIRRLFGLMGYWLSIHEKIYLSWEWQN